VLIAPPYPRQRARRPSGCRYAPAQALLVDRMAPPRLPAPDTSAALSSRPIRRGPPLA